MVNIAPKNRERVLAGCLERRLVSYAAAAGAAGVGLLALASPAQADIVYTPVNVPIPHNGDFIAIDLNHDGVADFSLWIWAYADFGPFYSDLFLYAGDRNNGVEEAGRSFAARLPAGAVIGPGQKFIPAHGTFGIPLMALKRLYTGGTHSICAGPWVPPARNAYLGLMFDISGQEHFGWARLTAGCFAGGSGDTAILTGYAYDTVAGQSIRAGQTTVGGDAATATPEPGTLGLLALGSLGLGFWRRRKQESEFSSRKSEVKA